MPGLDPRRRRAGYSLSHAFGAVLDNPDLVVACVVGDGEAETGPLATAWHSNKFLDPATDGAVLPILHLNGYKISNPTVLARISREELEQLLRGYGWTPHFVEGHEPAPMHEAMAATLDAVVEEIKRIQEDARRNGNLTRPRWPMIVLNSPKGWTGPKMVDGLQVEGTFRAHQVPLSDPATHPEHLKLLEDWLRSYRPQELFDEHGRLVPELAELAPEGARRMGANPHANGGILLRDLRMPDFRDYAVDVPTPGVPGIGDTHVLGRFLRDVAKLQQRAEQFSRLRPRRDAFQRPGSGLRGDQTPMGCRHRSERRVSGAQRARAGDAERAPMRGLARRLPAHRAARGLQLLRGVHPYRGFDVQPARQVAEGHRPPAVAPQDRLAELPPGLACLAPGSQRLHAPGSRFHRPCGEQEGRDRAGLSSARRQLPLVGDGPLPAQPPLRQRRDRRQASGAAMAGDGSRRRALRAKASASGNGPATTRALHPTWSWLAVATCPRWRRSLPSPSCASICPS